MESEPIHRQVVLTSIEKNIDAKILTQYLTASKAIEHISKFTRKNDKFVLQFVNQKQASRFIQERAFVDKIIKKKLNLYPALFEDENGAFQIYQAYGMRQQMERKVFEICYQYGPCRVSVLEKKAVIYLQKKQGIRQQSLFEGLKQLGISSIKIDQDQSFVCSIELLNYLPIKSLPLTKQEAEASEQSLRIFMCRFSQKPIRGIEVKAFLHKESIPMLKAYFKYSSNKDTLDVFQRLRTHLVPLQAQLRTRLYYYSKQSNSFRTLFTSGLQMPNQMSQKQFEHLLLEDFRKINSNVVQIILKQCMGHIWTGKIYMRDEESGKQLVSQYPLKRNFIFRHYKDKSKITINIFQDKKAINQIRKLQNHTERMLQHIKNTREQEKQIVTPIMPNYKGGQPKRQEQKPRRQFRNRQQENKQQIKKIKYRPKQQDFPSI